MRDFMTVYDFLSGAVAAGFFVCALFFLGFWRRTRDALFLAFALAFVLLGVGQSILALANIPTEERGSIYLFRLAAFALIIIAIVRKNRSASA
jgi:membrane-associated PAP2 superfamily phosphatase